MLKSGILNRICQICWVNRGCVSASFAPKCQLSTLKPDHVIESNIPDHVDFDICPEWKSGAVEQIKYNLVKDMRIINDFVTDTEEDVIFSEIEPYLKRMRYEFDHWDNAIHGFRETERSKWNTSSDLILKRAKETALVDTSQALPHIHILDLDAKGHIKPHVDAIRFCGDTVAGICLLSPAVMRLQHTEYKELFADFLLSRRCFYIMKDTARYNFTHEVLKPELSYFKGQQIKRTRRISLISRSQPDCTQK